MYFRLWFAECLSLLKGVRHPSTQGFGLRKHQDPGDDGHRTEHHWRYSLPVIHLVNKHLDKFEWCFNASIQNYQKDFVMILEIFKVQVSSVIETKLGLHKALLTESSLRLVYWQYLNLNAHIGPLLVNMGANFIFMHDNTRPHSAHLINGYIQDVASVSAAWNGQLVGRT